MKTIVPAMLATPIQAILGTFVALAGALQSVPYLIIALVSVNTASVIPVLHGYQQRVAEQQQHTQQAAWQRGYDDALVVSVRDLAERQDSCC